jgi:hypothetical protein
MNNPCPYTSLTSNVPHFRPRHLRWWKFLVGASERQAEAAYYDGLMDGSGEGLAASFHAGDDERLCGDFGARFGLDVATATRELIELYGLRATHAAFSTCSLVCQSDDRLYAYCMDEEDCAQRRMIAVNEIHY